MVNSHFPHVTNCVTSSPTSDVTITVERKAVARNRPSIPGTGPSHGHESGVYATGADQLRWIFNLRNEGK